MISSRFYRPKIASLTRDERDFISTAKNADMNYFVPDADIMTRSTVMRSDKYQITYKFSYGERNNMFTRKKSGKSGMYGASRLSLRLLYDFLCRQYNGGEYFIDTYFDRVFSSRLVHDEFEELNDTIIARVGEAQAELLARFKVRKDGLPNLKYKAARLFMNTKLWKDPIVRAESDRVAKHIKQDIVTCLSTGKLPLRKSKVTPKTEEERAKFIGLDRNRFFYASGQLIEALSIYVEMKAV